MRRQTLGPLSGSNLNSRPSMGRQSLGGAKSSRMSDAGAGMSKSRQSMGAAENPRRSSVARYSEACSHQETNLNRAPLFRLKMFRPCRLTLLVLTLSPHSSRRSSAYGVRGAVDPRPLSDKQYMSDSIRTVVRGRPFGHAGRGTSLLRARRRVATSLLCTGIPLTPLVLPCLLARSTTF